MAKQEAGLTMFESAAIALLVVRIVFYVGIILVICRYDDSDARYRPVVGLLATIIAGACACQAFIELRSFWHNELTTSFEPFLTAIVSFLFLAVVQTGGNVAIFLRPIQTAYASILKVSNAKH